MRNHSESSGTTPAPLFAALVLVALVPAVGVLWFMSVAMRNERLAVQQRITDVYFTHLTSLQRQVPAFWAARQAVLRTETKGSPAEIFAAHVRARRADAVVICDPAGKPLYPTTASSATPSSETADAARALQVAATELLKNGQTEPALAKLAELAGDARLRNASNAAGALIAPNAQLLILKTAAPDSARWRQTLDDLAKRLNDYSDSAIPSSQRRFLMAEARALAPAAKDFLTLAAEELAAEYLEHATAPPAEGKWSATPLAKVWGASTADHGAVALFREERLRKELEAFLAPFVLPDARITVLAPSSTPAAHPPALSVDAGEFLPGWRLALGFRGGDPLAEASARQTRFYLWVGVGVVLIIGVVALLVARYVAAQMRLARLKNELVSTVSHELKTPLASMRALVDTLAAGRFRDERQLRDYLHLIAKENQRLCQVIENFLAFSRLERGKQRFQFESLAPADVVRTAVEVLKEKLEAPGCRFELRLPAGLPRIQGDAEALATVLVNLLDNACKYTNGTKQIAVQARADARHVWLEVEDNGIGLSAAEARKIFDRFYQVDQSLTRQRGGCGLGLSIVKFIVEAHAGTVEVRSEPGHGSTFRVRIPVAEIQASEATDSAVKPKPVDHGLSG